MTQDTSTPDRIYAWLFIQDKQGHLVKGGWNDEPDRRDTEYLKSTPMREASEDLLEALIELMERRGECFIPSSDGWDRRAWAAIAKAKGQTE